MFEICQANKTKQYLHPIIDWSDLDVWNYIRSRNLPYCSLYDEGWKRLGCIGCPMTRDKDGRSRARWPKQWAVWKRGMKALWGSEINSKRNVTLRARWSSFDALWAAWVDRDASLGGDAREDSCPLFDGAGTE